MHLHWLIAAGNFSTVRQVTHRLSGQPYALKVIDKKLYEGREGALKSEIAILKLVRHPHIVSLIEDYDTPTHLCLLFRFCEGGELFDRIIEEARACCMSPAPTDPLPAGLLYREGCKPRCAPDC